MKKQGRNFSLVCLLLLSLGVSSFSIAESRAIDKDFFKSIRLEAEQSSPNAQYNLGLLYYWMNYYENAREWFEKAAGQGLAQAQFSLGVMYMIGQGVAQNQATAKELFKQACDNGDKTGCNNYRLLMNKLAE